MGPCLFPCLYNRYQTGHNDVGVRRRKSAGFLLLVFVSEYIYCCNSALLCIPICSTRNLRNNNLRSLFAKSECGLCSFMYSSNQGKCSVNDISTVALLANGNIWSRYSHCLDNGSRFRKLLARLTGQETGQTTGWMALQCKIKVKTRHTSFIRILRSIVSSSWALSSFTYPCLTI